MAFADIIAFNKQPIGNGPGTIDQGSLGTRGPTVERNTDYAYTAGKGRRRSDFRFYADPTRIWADASSANDLDVTSRTLAAGRARAGRGGAGRPLHQRTSAAVLLWRPTRRRSRPSKPRRPRRDSQGGRLEPRSARRSTSARASRRSRRPADGGRGVGEDVCGEDCTYDPAAAKALLEKAGAYRATRSRSRAWSDQGTRRRRPSATSDQENLGVECEVKVFESTFGSLRRALHKLGPMTRASSSVSGAAVNPALADLIARCRRGCGVDYTGYSNPEFDKLIIEGNELPDETTSIAEVAGRRGRRLRGLRGSCHQWRNNVGGYSTNVSNVRSIRVGSSTSPTSR